MVNIKAKNLNKINIENINFPLNDEILILKNILKEKHINSIINDGSYLLKKSKTGKINSKVNSNIRDSYSGYIGKIDNKYIINIKALLKKKYNFNKIDMQLLYYKDGGFYNPHLDAFKNTEEEENRKYTILIYLNTPQEGGSTYFTKWDTRIKPEKGTGIVWKNLKNGLPDPNTEHTGEKVVGEKYAINIWLT